MLVKEIVWGIKTKFKRSSKLVKILEERMSPPSFLSVQTAGASKVNKYLKYIEVSYIFFACLKHLQMLLSSSGRPNVPSGTKQMVTTSGKEGRGSMLLREICTSRLETLVRRTLVHDILELSLGDSDEDRTSAHEKTGIQNWTAINFKFVSHNLPESLQLVGGLWLIKRQQDLQFVLPNSGFDPVRCNWMVQFTCGDSQRMVVCVEQAEAVSVATW